jgi:antirestriction protein ArdC
MKKKTVYEIVTERIIEKLKQGEIPWHRPWVNCPAVNWESQRPYRGINQLLLEPGEYATWNQVKKAGGHVKKGAKSHMVTFWKFIEVKNEDEEGVVETIPYLRYYRVFNIKDCEGIESKRKVETFDHDPIEEAEKIIEGYPDAPEITFAPGRAFYRPSDDIISIPEKSDFEQVEEYYSTIFHEMVHSTGHKKRLGRNGVTKLSAFGSHEYSKEELVAEIGAAMLCGLAGIEQETLDNSAAYVQGWLKKLEGDSKFIVSAASQAQKAADYIAGDGRAE